MVARTARRADSRNARWPVDRRGSEGIAAYHGLMRQTRWIFAGALTLVAAIALLVASLGRGNLVVDPAESPSPAASNGRATAAIATASVETATPSVDATAQRTPTASTPSDPPATAPRRASGPPLLAWAEFLARLNADRSTVEGLNGALTTAAQAQDT